LLSFHITICLLLFPAWLAYSSSLKMEAVHPSETSINFYQTAWCRSPEGTTFHRYRQKSHVVTYDWDFRLMQPPGIDEIRLNSGTVFKLGRNPFLCSLFNSEFTNHLIIRPNVA
jgi:hypothetical protein